MIDHVSLGTRKFDEAIEFYSACFSPLGYHLEHRTPEEAAFGPAGNRIFWLYPAQSEDSLLGHRSHVAITANAHENINQFFEAAMQRGAKPVRPPGQRPDISPNYFG